MPSSILTRHQPAHRLALALSAALLLGGRPALATPPAAPSVESYLKAHDAEPEEDVELHGTGQADLDRDGQPETVVVWLLTGPTYWRNLLTVLSPDAKSGYRERAALVLEGEADFSRVTPDGVIEVKQKTFGPNDPACCPSQLKTIGYRLAGGKLVPAAR